jgi:hypothetical protein
LGTKWLKPLTLLKECRRLHAIGCGSLRWAQPVVPLGWSGWYVIGEIVPLIVWPNESVDVT